MEHLLHLQQKNYQFGTDKISKIYILYSQPIFRKYSTPSL